MNTLKDLHTCYVRMTKREAKFLVYERSWYEFVKSGYDLGDLEVVLRFIERSNRTHDFKYSLHLGRLLNDLQRFDDLLCEAKATERNRVPKKTPRETVLEQFRPVVVEKVNTATAKTVGEIMKQIGASA